MILFCKKWALRSSWWEGASSQALRWLRDRNTRKHSHDHSHPHHGCCHHHTPQFRDRLSHHRNDHLIPEMPLLHIFSFPHVFWWLGQGLDHKHFLKYWHGLDALHLLVNLGQIFVNLWRSGFELHWEVGLAYLRSAWFSIIGGFGLGSCLDKEMGHQLGFWCWWREK